MASKFLLCLSLLISLTTHANCQQSNPEQIMAMAQDSSKALNALFARERSNTGGEVGRNAAILSVVLAAEGRLDARAVQSLSKHVQRYPDDQFAKLYEGYAWVFSAGEYVRKKNYLRAAEDIKRGFFLMDEAVDSAPENWRLRYLRLRMDAFVPADLGRYVIALKDAAILVEAFDHLPPQMRPFVLALGAAALTRAGHHEMATSEFDSVRTQFGESAISAFSSVCGLQDFFTVDEIDSVLVHALEYVR